MDSSRFFCCKDYLKLRFRSLDGQICDLNFYLASDMPQHVPFLLSNGSTFLMGYEQRKREDIVVDYTHFDDMISLDPLTSDEWDILNYLDGHKNDLFELFLDKDLTKINYEYINELTKDFDPEARGIVRKIFYQYPLCLATDQYNISSIPDLYFEPELKQKEENIRWKEY